MKRLFIFLSFISMLAFSTISFCDKISISDPVLTTQDPSTLDIKVHVDQGSGFFGPSAIILGVSTLSVAGTAAWCFRKQIKNFVGKRWDQAAWASRNFVRDSVNRLSGALTQRIAEARQESLLGTNQIRRDIQETREEGCAGRQEVKRSLIDEIYSLKRDIHGRCDKIDENLFEHMNNIAAQVKQQGDDLTNQVDVLKASSFSLSEKLDTVVDSVGAVSNQVETMATNFETLQKENAELKGEVIGLRSDLRALGLFHLAAASKKVERLQQEEGVKSANVFSSMFSVAAKRFGFGQSSNN